MRIKVGVSSFITVTRGVQLAKGGLGGWLVHALTHWTPRKKWEGERNRNKSCFDIFLLRIPKISKPRVESETPVHEKMPMPSSHPPIARPSNPYFLPHSSPGPRSSRPGAAVCSHVPPWRSALYACELKYEKKKKKGKNNQFVHTKKTQSLKGSTAEKRSKTSPSSSPPRSVGYRIL